MLTKIANGIYLNAERVTAVIMYDHVDRSHVFAILDNGIDVELYNGSNKQCLDEIKIITNRINGNPDDHN